MLKRALILTEIIALLIGGASLLSFSALHFNDQVSTLPLNYENMSDNPIYNHKPKQFPENISSERQEDENYTITDDFDFEEIQEPFTPSKPDHEHSIPSLSELGINRTDL